MVFGHGRFVVAVVDRLFPCLLLAAFENQKNRKDPL
jgi:hypothetical protein